METTKSIALPLTTWVEKAALGKVETLATSWEKHGYLINTNQRGVTCALFWRSNKSSLLPVVIQGTGRF